LRFIDLNAGFAIIAYRIMDYCPVCYTFLEARDCAPCDDCGGYPEELDHFRNEKHTYAIYEIYNGIRLQLCDFCILDFASYKPEYFGLKDGKHISDHFNFVKEVGDPHLEKDKFCTQCNSRLNFLQLVSTIRQMNDDNPA
jgi:hypothetical protein